MAYAPQDLQSARGEALQPTRLEPDSLADDVAGFRRKFQTPARDRLPINGLLCRRETTEPQFLFRAPVRMFSTMTSRRVPIGTARRFPDDTHDLVPWDRLCTEGDIEYPSATMFAAPPA